MGLTPQEQADLQARYDELKRRGALTANPEAVAWAHEVRSRGLVKDATQGGLITPAARTAVPNFGGPKDPYGDPADTPALPAYTSHRPTNLPVYTNHDVLHPTPVRQQPTYMDTIRRSAVNAGKGFIDALGPLADNQNLGISSLAHTLTGNGAAATADAKALRRNLQAARAGANSILNPLAIAHTPLGQGVVKVAQGGLRLLDTRGGYTETPGSLIKSGARQIGQSAHDDPVGTALMAAPFVFDGIHGLLGERLPDGVPAVSKTPAQPPAPRPVTKPLPTPTDVMANIARGAEAAAPKPRPVVPPVEAATATARHIVDTHPADAPPINPAELSDVLRAVHGITGEQAAGVVRSTLPPEAPNALQPIIPPEAQGAPDTGTAGQPAPVPAVPAGGPQVAGPVPATPHPDEVAAAAQPQFKVGDRIQPGDKQQFAGTVTAVQDGRYTVENPDRPGDGIGKKFDIPAEQAVPSTEKLPDILKSDKSYKQPTEAVTPAAEPVATPAPPEPPAPSTASAVAQAETPANPAGAAPDNALGMTMGHIKAGAEELGIAVPDKASFRRSWEQTKADAMDPAQSLGEKADGLSMEAFYVGNVRLRELTETQLPAMLDKAAKSPTPELQGRIDAAMHEVTDLSAKLYKSGSEAGRRLAFQKAFVTDDLSPAAILKRAQAAAGGELRPETAQSLTRLAGRAQAMKKAIDARVGADADLAVSRLKRRAANAPKNVDDILPKTSVNRARSGASNRLVTQERFEEANARLKAAAGRLNAGLPLDLLPDLVTYGVYHVERGLRTFGAFAAQVKSDFPKLTDEDHRQLWAETRDSIRGSSSPVAARATTAAQKSGDYQLGRLEGGMKPLEKVERADLAAVGVREYANGAKDLATFGKRLRAGTGRNLDDATIQTAFTDAAQKYRADYKGLDEIKKGMAETIAREAFHAKPWLGKLGYNVENVVGAGRALLTSFDLSAPGRQGALLFGADPIMGMKSMGPMVRAAASESAANAIDAAIRSRPNYARAKESGLSLSDTDHQYDLSKAEEAYRTNLAEKIPVFGKGIKASERAYVTFLNKIRMDTFDSLTKDLERDGTAASAGDLKAVSDYINVATGRGDLGKAGNMAAELLNKTFFAPRFAASRFQYLAGEPIGKAFAPKSIGGLGAPRAGRLIARQYVRTAASAATILGLAKLAGAQVSLDPTSSDFLKIKVGNTRYDILAGMQQTAVYLSRLATGSKNGHALNGKGFNGTRLTLTEDFARSKLAPFPGAAVNVMDGKDMGGQPVTVGSTLKSTLIPMNYQDLIEGAKQEGLPTAAAVLAAQTIGVGANIQQPRSGGTLKGMGGGMGKAMKGF